jgi:hypothetical protein
MKHFRAFLLGCLVASGALLISGCATTGQVSAPVSQTSPGTGMKGIEQSSASDAGWANSLGQFFLNSLYATAVANQSH